MRKRRVIKRGEKSYSIALLKADIDDFGLKEGDEVDIEDLNRIRPTSKRKKHE